MYRFLLAAFLYAGARLPAQPPTRYPDIPRIDVHAHVGDSLERMASYMKMRGTIKEKLYADIGAGLAVLPAGTAGALDRPQITKVELFKVIVQVYVMSRQCP